MNHAKFFFTLSFMTILFGCQQQPKKNNTLENHIESLNSVALQYAPKPVVKKTRIENEPLLPPEITPTPLKTKYTIRYYGEPDNFMSKISERLGFEYHLVGTPTLGEKSVWVKENSQPLFDILYRLGLKLGHDAILDIIIYPAQDKFKVNLIYPED